MYHVPRETITDIVGNLTSGVVEDASLLHNAMRMVQKPEEFRDVALSDCDVTPRLTDTPFALEYTIGNLDDTNQLQAGNYGFTLAIFRIDAIEEIQLYMSCMRAAAYREADRVKATGQKILTLATSTSLLRAAMHSSDVDFSEPRILTGLEFRIREDPVTGARSSYTSLLVPKFLDEAAA